VGGVALLGVIGLAISVFNEASTGNKPNPNEMRYPSEQHGYQRVEQARACRCDAARVRFLGYVIAQESSTQIKYG